ncbi:hypothetical protein P872_12130 [Rhodonellum psychrophilum GCM71 = DSM 17998]|uniref:Uncharacterized protein n=1 Tax=Rhodonellum psychrophilum GCM71 = DSM 17998 TaxID=1123057 RepID=U5BKF3_9BACT|nr:hypothetical protein P872_12130 [Rhodonellum psychrophilum GCM71 = DSM 17998]
MASNKLKENLFQINLLNSNLLNFFHEKNTMKRVFFSFINYVFYL